MLIPDISPLANEQVSPDPRTIREFCIEHRGWNIDHTPVTVALQSLGMTVREDEAADQLIVSGPSVSINDVHAVIERFNYQIAEA